MPNTLWQGEKVYTKAHKAALRTFIAGRNDREGRSDGDLHPGEKSPRVSRLKRQERRSHLPRRELPMAL
jgi:hypothetical protein